MKKIINLLVSLFVVLGLLFTSCGTGKKLVESEAIVEKLNKENNKKLSLLNECNKQVENLNMEKTSLKDENSLIKNDLKALTYESNFTIADQAKRLKNLQNIIQNQKDKMSKLKNSIADALMNYKTDEIYVDYRDGNVYVSMEEKLLFKTGSDVVDPKGKEALKSLSAVLNNTKFITVLIEGHTDSVHINNKQFQDNWALSTARAASIVRILTNDYGFDSNFITASGRSKFHPVKSNTTKEGRASNRRTEVILSPDLKELQQLLYQ